MQHTGTNAVPAGSSLDIYETIGSGHVLEEVVECDRLLVRPRNQLRDGWIARSQAELLSPTGRKHQPGDMTRTNATTKRPPRRREPVSPIAFPSDGHAGVNPESLGGLDGGPQGVVRSARLAP